MSDLSFNEKMRLEKLLNMSTGYVLTFTDNSFRDFFWDNSQINIDDAKYRVNGTSKAKRLRTFWSLENNKTVGKIISCLLDYLRSKKELDGEMISLADERLFDECQSIANRLTGNNPVIKAPINTNRDNQLERLLSDFDEMALSNDHQRRGFSLQDLLNDLFKISGIETTDSFQRSNGGEQIDGAFSWNGWFYLVECKWTKKLSDTKEVDSLLAKVGRSGNQTMGLFISIEGWSENVIPLSKTNPGKKIFLMDGYDLRCVLSGEVTLETLLKEKLKRLNLHSEPFYSARYIK